MSFADTIAKGNAEGPSKVLNVVDVKQCFIRSVFVKPGVPAEVTESVLLKFAYMNSVPVPFEIQPEDANAAPKILNYEAPTVKMLPRFDIKESKHLEQYTIFVSMRCFAYEGREKDKARPHAIIFAINGTVFDYFYNQIKNNKPFNIYEGTVVIDVTDRKPSEQERNVQEMFYGFKKEVITVSTLDEG